jgi:HD-like signal output (HDOD) protein
MSSALEEKILNELLTELERNQLVLPSLPEVALRVREVIDDEQANSSQIAKEISSDAGLSARLIQVANSPLLRGARKIESMEMAVTRMGSAMVRNVITSLIAQQIFQPTTEISDRLFRDFWEHSTSVAAISHALAGFARLKPDVALLGGLVHDMVWCMTSAPCRLSSGPRICRNCWKTRPR